MPGAAAAMFHVKRAYTSSSQCSRRSEIDGREPTVLEQSVQPDLVTVDDLQTPILENNVHRCQLSDLLLRRTVLKAVNRTRSRARSIAAMPRPRRSVPARSATFTHLQCNTTGNHFRRLGRATNKGLQRSCFT